MTWEILAADQGGLQPRLNPPLRIVTGRAVGKPAARFDSMTEKSRAIPAIRENACEGRSLKMAEIQDKIALFAAFRCQAGLFHLDEIRHLNPARQTSRTVFPAANPLPGG